MWVITIKHKQKENMETLFLLSAGSSDILKGSIKEK